MQKKGPVMRISPFTGPDYFLKATPHNESCGALRKFCALTSFRFHGNTSSITAKPRLVSTQNLLANRSCSIMRYYPGKTVGEIVLRRFTFFHVKLICAIRREGKLDIHAEKC